VCWAIAYDTEYAMVDREDDKQIGIRTSAITLGHYDIAGVMIGHVLFLALLIVFGVKAGMGVYFYAGVSVAALLGAMQYRMIQGRDAEACFRAFRQNNWVGVAIFAGILAHSYFPKPF
jgi:4-hydroxybenzoate polyprenyltransferase